MEKKSIKISVKLQKILSYFFFIFIAIMAVFALKSFLKSNPTANVGLEKEQEIIFPFEAGVADSGFEGGGIKITALNARYFFDGDNKISGNKSLGIYFTENANASVKIADYLNETNENYFYRLSFWAIANTGDDKKITIKLANKDFVQNLGEMVLSGNQKIQHYNFVFQADKNYQDLVFSSEDGVGGQIWVDDVFLEKLEVDSAEQLSQLKPSVSGNTFLKNVDWSWNEGEDDSADFFSEKDRRFGQIFQPSKDLLSGVAFKVQKVGSGGTGNYRVELREYDKKTGIISEEVLASHIIINEYSFLIKEEIEEKEKQMKEDFNQRENDIKTGLIPNDSTDDQYPPDYTQKQIDEEKAQKRKEKLALEIKEMKETYNKIEEIEVPIAARINTEKKYWIGISNSGVEVNKNNYLKVFYDSEAGEEINPGFLSEKSREWKEFYTLWLKTFYPEHNQAGEQKILSGAVISDFGKDKMLYRYQFNSSDNNSALGFPGRKVYDLFDGYFDGTDIYGNYYLSEPEYYSIYKFNTLYPVKKVLIREGTYHQSLSLEFSSDGENWEEIFSDNPAENNQKINSFSISPSVEKSIFYLRMRPEGEKCYPIEIFLEAELAKYSE